jgi:sucrose phosphorylase
MLTMPGVPGIYFHSLVGSMNDEKGVERTGALRSINREKLHQKVLERELEVEETRKIIFNAYMNMLSIRRKEKAFHPQTPFTIHHVHEQIFAIERHPGDGLSFLAIHNLSSRTITGVSFSVSPGIRKFFCMLTKEKIDVNDENRIHVTLPPNHFLWLQSPG